MGMVDGSGVGQSMLRRGGCRGSTGLDEWMEALLSFFLGKSGRAAGGRGSTQEESAQGCRRHSCNTSWLCCSRAVQTFHTSHTQIPHTEFVGNDKSCVVCGQDLIVTGGEDGMIAVWTLPIGAQKVGSC